MRRSAWEGRNKFIVASIYTKKYHKGLESPTRNPEGGVRAPSKICQEGVEPFEKRKKKGRVGKAEISGTRSCIFILAIPNIF